MINHAKALDRKLAVHRLKPDRLGEFVHTVHCELMSAKISVDDLQLTA
jgi:hypothetical protein